MGETHATVVGTENVFFFFFFFFLMFLCFSFSFSFFKGLNLYIYILGWVSPKFHFRAASGQIGVRMDRTEHH